MNIATASIAALLKLIGLDNSPCLYYNPFYVPQCAVCVTIFEECQEIAIGIEGDSQIGHGDHIMLAKI